MVQDDRSEELASGAGAGADGRRSGAQPGLEALGSVRGDCGSASRRYPMPMMRFVTRSKAQHLLELHDSAGPTPAAARSIPVPDVGPRIVGPGCGLLGRE